MKSNERPCGCGGTIIKKPGPGRWPMSCESCRGPRAAASRKCEQCGDPFEGRAGRKYCGDRCKSRAAHAIQVANGKAAARYQAARADGRYDAWRTAQNEKRSAARPVRPCPHCGEPIPPRYRKSCASWDCRREARNEQMRGWMRKRVAESRANGESYYAKWRGPEHHAKLALLPKVPEKIAARKQEGWQRRRAQKKSLPSEQFRHEDVYARDDWICQLCTESVDPETRYPDPLSPSLDHVIPLAAGGHHVWDNVQLAHLVCNVRKNARIE